MGKKSRHQEKQREETSPKTCYTIWFSQRTGSTLLTQALASTGMAGEPGEWLHEAEGHLEPPSTHRAVALRQKLWEQGSTPNRVFGMKVSFYEPFFSKVISLFQLLPECKNKSLSRSVVWETAFPHGKHIFMTRRNKIRLAVSWWKAVQSGEWHRAQGTQPIQTDLSEAYSFDAINHLLVESVLREAGMQAFFSEGGIQPLTIVYEDFIDDYAGTFQRVLAYLGFEDKSVDVPAPGFEKLADDLSEAWVQRFRRERQAGWKNRGW
jgi:LPS sulfotransferase NodH